MSEQKKIFVSSPFGFSEAGRLFMYEKLLPLLGNLGLTVIDPWVLTPQAEIDAVMAMPVGPDRDKAMQEMFLQKTTDQIYSFCLG